MGTLGSILFAIIAFMIVAILAVVGLFVYVCARWMMGTGGLTSAEMKMLKEQFAKKAQAEQEAALAAKLKDIATPPKT